MTDKPASSETLKISSADAGLAAYWLVEQLLNALTFNEKIEPSLRDAIAKVAADLCETSGKPDAANLIKQRFSGSENMNPIDAALAIGYDLKTDG